MASYTEALAYSTRDNPELAIFFANRAACYLKLAKNEECVRDCTHGRPERVKKKRIKRTKRREEKKRGKERTKRRKNVERGLKKKKKKKKEKDREKDQ